MGLTGEEIDVEPVGGWGDDEEFEDEEGVPKGEARDGVPGEEGKLRVYVFTL